MNKTLPIILLSLTLVVGCTSKQHREYRAADNSVVATADYVGSDSLNAVWQFTDKEGNPLVAGYDSLRVTELGPQGHPMSVCFFLGESQRWMQFYSSMVLRSDGVVRNGQREGLWVFYYPNGNKQTEYAFVEGKEEGPYRVYRDNGVPYYVGQCHQGRRVGVWEVYNSDGTLATTEDYGD